MTQDQTARSVLQEQLAIQWSFANDFIIGKISPDLAAWKPTPTSPTVHETTDGWIADWFDESDPAAPLAPATIGWLLWHIEWW